MGRLARLAARSPTERSLLLKAAVLIAVIRVGLSTLRFERLRLLLARLAVPGPAGHPAHPADASVESVIWAVEAVGRHLPAIGTCLTQALAAHVLLARRGFPSNLRIGVARTANGTFEAHAWLERDGTILIGGRASRRYTPMPALNGLEP